jgi:hypothetical protein
MEFISAATQRGNISEQELTSYLRNSRDKEILFGEEIQDFLKILYLRAIDIKTTAIEIESAQTDDERKQLIRRKSEQCKWFHDQFDESKRLFRKYLSIEKK